jgi:hypothetical protein
MSVLPANVVRSYPLCRWRGELVWIHQFSICHLSLTPHNQYPIAQKVQTEEQVRTVFTLFCQTLFHIGHGHLHIYFFVRILLGRLLFWVDMTSEGC